MINPVNSSFEFYLFKDKNKIDVNNDSSFLDILKGSLNNTNNLLKESDKLTEAFAIGEVENIHDVTIAAEKASLAMNLTLAVQNKVIEAYNEIMRIQI